MGMADRIKERRLAMNYTQEELAQKLGLQKSAIAKYEKGRVQNIKRSVIAQMANVLDCSPSYLMDWEKEDLKADFLFKTYTDPNIEILIEQYSRLDPESQNDLKKYMELLLLRLAENKKQFDTKQEND